MIKFLIDFIKSPSVMDNVPELNAKNFLALLAVTYSIVVPYSILKEWMGADQFQSMVEQMLRERPGSAIVGAILIAPVWEEMVFRYHLSLKPKAIIWSLILSSLIMIGNIYLGGAVFVYLLIMLLGVRINKLPKTNYLVYISALLFAIIHIENYKDFDLANVFIWVPFLVASQFLAGLVLSFIRLHYGVINSMLFHAVYNGILVIPAIYFLD